MRVPYCIGVGRLKEWVVNAATVGNGSVSHPVQSLLSLCHGDLYPVCARETNSIRSGALTVSHGAVEDYLGFEGVAMADQVA